MGTCCAPTYANLYLGGWERYVFSNEQLSSHTNEVLVWLRYIDDIFIIWTGSQQTLASFVDHLNSNTFNLKFTYNSDLHKISFLDLTIYKDANLCLATTLYRKETAGNTVLHASSAHPSTLVRSIPYAQYIRLRRNCTTDNEFKHHADALRERLLKRGYSKSLLRRAFNKAWDQSRNALLFSKEPRREEHLTTKFITKYSHQQYQFCNILQQHWHILSEDPILRKYVSDYPEIVFKKAPSLRDKLTKSHFAPSQAQTTNRVGIHTCGHCSFCPWVSTGYKFQLPNGETFCPPFWADCNTQGVIYLMTCRCGIFYVGKTIRHLWQRIRDHVYYSTNGKMLSPISRHLDLCHRFDTSVASFIALAVIPQDPRGGDWDRRILQQEAKWIERLNATRWPGINEVQSYKSFLG